MQLIFNIYLAKHCNIICENNSGNIALHLACREGCNCVADLLASKVPQTVNYILQLIKMVTLHLSSLAYPAVVKRFNREF